MKEGGSECEGILILAQRQDIFSKTFIPPGGHVRCTYFYFAILFHNLYPS